MKIDVSIKDRHGLEIELNQPIAIKVTRRSGSYGSWCRQTNINHFKSWWIPGHIEFDKSLEFNHSPRLFIVSDKLSKKALEKPMGKEQIEQNVDDYNINFFDPENFDSLMQIRSGEFQEVPDGKDRD